MNLNRLKIIISFFLGSINQKRDWLLIILFSLILIIFFCLFNLNMYKGIDGKELYVDISNENISVKKINEQNLQKLISSYEDKREMFENVRIVKSVDPSL